MPAITSSLFVWVDQLYRKKGPLLAEFTGSQVAPGTAAYEHTSSRFEPPSVVLGRQPPRRHRQAVGRHSTLWAHLKEIPAEDLRQRLKV